MVCIIVFMSRQTPYSNPEKYEGAELEHNVLVALRELALEKVRKEKYPGYPSRMAALYVSKSYKEAEQWADYFASLGRPTYSVVKIKVNGCVFVEMLISVLMEVYMKKKI